MIEWLSEFATSLTWQNVLVGVVIFVVTFVVNLAIVSFILVKIPADYFTKHHKTEFWAGPNPALHASLVIGKNILGFSVSRSGNHFVCARGAGSGPTHYSSRDHASGLSRKAQVGIEVAAETRDREDDK